MPIVGVCSACGHGIEQDHPSQKFCKKCKGGVKMDKKSKEVISEVERVAKHLETKQFVNRTVAFDRALKIVEIARLAGVRKNK